MVLFCLWDVRCCICGFFKMQESHWENNWKVGYWPFMDRCWISLGIIVFNNPENQFPSLIPGKMGLLLSSGITFTSLWLKGLDVRFQIVLIWWLEPNRYCVPVRIWLKKKYFFENCWKWVWDGNTWSEIYWHFKIITPVCFVFEHEDRKDSLND